MVIAQGQRGLALDVDLVADNVAVGHHNHGSGLAFLHKIGGLVVDDFLRDAVGVQRRESAFQQIGHVLAFGAKHALVGRLTQHRQSDEHRGPRHLSIIRGLEQRYLFNAVGRSSGIHGADKVGLDGIHVTHHGMA